jgi:hypothetical protein
VPTPKAFATLWNAGHALQSTLHPEDNWWNSEAGELNRMPVPCLARFLVALAEHHTQSRAAIRWNGSAPFANALRALFQRPIFPSDLSAPELKLACRFMMRLCSGPDVSVLEALASVSPAAAARLAAAQQPADASRAVGVTERTVIAVEEEPPLAFVHFGSRPASAWQALADARGASGGVVETAGALKQKCSAFLGKLAKDPPIWLQLLYLSDCSARRDMQLLQYARRFCAVSDASLDAFAWIIIALAIGCTIHIVSPSALEPCIDTGKLLSQPERAAALADLKQNAPQLLAPGRRLVIAHVSFGDPFNSLVLDHFAALAPAVAHATVMLLTLLNMHRFRRAPVQPAGPSDPVIRWPLHGERDRQQRTNGWRHALFRRSRSTGAT